LRSVSAQGKNLAAGESSIQYRDCAYEWRRLIRQSELSGEERVVKSNNLGAFYRFVYKRTTNRCGIGVIIDKNGSPITDSQQKANAFNVFFCVCWCH